MKKILPLLSIFLCLSCRVGKNKSLSENHRLQIMVDGNESPQELSKEYQSLGLTELKRSSKSQPLYTAVVELKAKKLSQLVEKLKNDNRIVSVKVLNKELTKSQSTNSSFGTSRPKKKKP